MLRFSTDKGLIKITEQDVKDFLARKERILNMSKKDLLDMIGCSSEADIQ